MDAIMQCVETILMKCADPVHGLLKAMKDGTPCAPAAQGWHSGFSESQTRTQLLLTVLIMASVNLSLWWMDRWNFSSVFWIVLLIVLVCLAVLRVCVASQGGCGAEPETCKAESRRSWNKATLNWMQILAIQISKSILFTVVLYRISSSANFLSTRCCYES